MRRSSTLAALAATAAALTIVTPAGATPLLPSARFDPAETTWASYRDATSAGHAAHHAKLKGSQMIVDLDVDVIDGAYRVGAVWQANSDGRAWRSRRDMTGAQFHARWEQLRRQGLRLHDQEVYPGGPGGALRFADVWVEDREHLAWASYRGLTAAAHAKRFAQYRDAGYLPVDLDVVATPSGRRYAAVWVENAEGLSWKLRRDLTSSQYASAFNAYRGQGLRSILVESYRHGAGQRYAGIWVENRAKRGWAAYRQMSATGFRNRWNRLRDEGYRLDGYEKYDTAAGARYAGVWRQSSERPDWPQRAAVDGFIQRDLDAYDVPGISVAVSQAGQIVYRRGFGDQDAAAGIWMHGGSVNRIASVSKAVAGVLALRMEAKHPGLSMADKVRTHLPWLPAGHDYSVEQTVTNRSCLASYPAPMTTANTTHYDTAKDAVTAFMGADLACTPGARKYSTHAYTVLGAVLERFEGKPVDAIVRDELTVPFGLTTLRPETLAGSLADRAQLYNTDNSEYDGDDTSNKTLGGGLVSTAPDLVRFADAILDGTLLTPAQTTRLWTPVGGYYGYGWQDDTDPAAPGDGRAVGKSGGQPGAKSYLRVYPEAGIVVAVLSNRWQGGLSARTLAKRIGDTVLAGQS